MEFNVNFPINKTKSIDLTGQFIFPNQVEDFAFVRTIDTVQAQGQMMFNIFLKFNKTVKTTRKGILKAFLGVGASTITTNARNPFYSGQEDENKYEFVSALLIAPGIDYKFKLKKNAKLAIGINYQYSPYRLEGALREDIGSSAIVPRIQFTFWRSTCLDLWENAMKENPDRNRQGFYLILHSIYCKHWKWQIGDMQMTLQFL